MKSKNIGIKLFIGLFIGLLFVQTPVFAEDNYEAGMTALQKNEYTKAIDFLKKALIEEPDNSSILNNIAVAYTSRGTYYYEKAHDIEAASNDYRNAIYYLEFYNKSANTATMNQNIPIAHQNLTNVLDVQKFKTDSANRLKKAKELRGKGELAAAVVEYSYAAKDRKYAYESYVAIGDIMKTFNKEYSAAVYYDKALAISSSDPYLHLKFGRTLYNLGNVDTAVRELDIASDNQKTKADALVLLEKIWTDRAQKRPNDPIAQMNLGTVYQNKGQYDLAMQQYKKAQTLDPKNQMINLNMATLLQEQGHYTEALNLYNGILKNRPNDITVNTYKAATLLQIGQTDEAISVYKSLLASNPNNTTIKNDLLNAINSSTGTSSVVYLADLAEKMPNDSQVVYNYAYSLHKAQRYNEALTQYEKSILLNPKNADAYLNIASIYNQQNNSEKAAEILSKAKTIFPDNDKIKQTLSDYQEEKTFNLMEKAANLYNNKDYNDAIITYKAIPNPTEEVFLGIGACYQAMERYDDAIGYYNRAIALDKANPNAHYFLGLAYLYKKDYTKAENSIKKAIELDGGNINEPDKIVNQDFADAYKAVKFAQSEQLMNTGIKLFENNKNDDAIINFNKAIAACKENGYAYYYRGLAYDTKNQNNFAINDYKKAISLNPELTMAYYSMALSYEALNNKAEAKKMYQKFLTVYKNNDEYTQYAKQRLSEI